MKKDISRPEKPKLLDQIRRACRLRHLSLRTEQAYVRWVRRFVRFHGLKHPAFLSETHVRAFLSYLASEQHVAASTQNQALSALLFLYRCVLEQPLDRLGPYTRARRPKRLPVVLTRQEVGTVIARLHGPHRLLASLLRAAPACA